MGSDYADATGQPRTIRFAGQDVSVYQLRPRDLGELDAWLREQTPNPKVEARKYLDGLPDAVAIHVWNQAVEDARDWPPRSDNEEGTRLLTMTAEGSARLLYVVLRRGRPGMTLDDARAMADAASPQEIQTLIRYASAVGDPDDPNPHGATGTDRTSTTAPPAPSSPSRTAGRSTRSTA